MRQFFFPHESGHDRWLYCHSLSLLGVHVAIAPDATATLAELNYVRNCFLHRGGIVDERAAEEAPCLNVPLGTKIRVGEETSKEYLKAVSDFAQGLLKGAFESRYSPVVQS